MKRKSWKGIRPSSAKTRGDAFRFMARCNELAGHKRPAGSVIFSSEVVACHPSLWYLNGDHGEAMPTGKGRCFPLLSEGPFGHGTAVTLISLWGGHLAPLRGRLCLPT